MKKILTILLSLFALNLSANTDPKAAFELSQKGEAVIIDVREKDEIESGMIKDAKWLPLSKATSDKEWMKEFKKLAGDKKIFLYCRSGNRSGKFQKILESNGIASENIGGFMTLKDQLPVTSGKK